MRRRAPQSVGAVEVRERYEEVPPINLNRELLEWVLENLLSNALTALDKPQGRDRGERWTAGRTPRRSVISVSDNGRGMTREEQSRAFEPGYSTKRRGWGWAGPRPPRRRGVPRRAHRHPPLVARRGHVDGDPFPTDGAQAGSAGPASSCTRAGVAAASRSAPVIDPSPVRADASVGPPLLSSPISSWFWSRPCTVIGSCTLM